MRRVPIRLWTLKEEIVAVITHFSENDESKLLEVKKFYATLKSPEIDDLDFDMDDVEELPGASGAENLDPSGNAMDDDANEMMAAMGGDDEDGEGSSEEESSDEEKDGEADDKSEEESEEKSDEDAEESDEDKKDGDSEDKEGDDKAEADSESKESLENGDEEGVVETDRPDLTLTSNPLRVEPSLEVKKSGFIYLSEVNMDNILIFSPVNFTPGQTIVIKFKLSHEFSLTCEVQYTMKVENKTRIIRENEAKYRVSCRLLYLFNGERHSLREFLESIELDIPPPPSAMKRPVSGGDDDDDFDDLGF